MTARFLLMLGAGPAMGAYDTARAPIALRAVRRRGDGKCDVLDLVDDQPAADEELFLYRRDPDAPAGSVHYQGRGRGARSGWLRTLNYAYVGRLDRDSGELIEAGPDELAWWETQHRQAIAAWAMGTREPEPSEQGALFA